jgi:DNA-binding transcriptional LysR family regulator
MSSPVKVPPAGAFAELLASPTQLLDVTMDQLRTLLAIREAGSPLRAARLLDREHSSVRKQVDTLNRVFQQVCGEALVVKQGRARDYLFTPTGDAVADIAARSFADWLAGITDRRRKLGATVSVATTEFTVDFLAQVWPDVAEEFTRREIQLDIAHVRTRDFWTQLDAKGVDLVCGSVAASPGTILPWLTMT